MSKLTLHRIELHSPQWYEFRSSGIGGSEAGTVLGSQFNQYGSRIKIFYQKIGAVPQDMEPNEVMRHGSLLEEYIVDKWWKFYDGDIDSTIRNQLSGVQVRKCKSVNGYYKNSDYPWLFCSLDRLINKNQRTIVDNNGAIILGDINPGLGILECKTVNSFVSRKYDGSLPPYQIIQCQMYMGVMGIDHCEMAILEDGRRFYCVPVPFSQNIFDYILETTHDFWYNHVVPAKELYLEMIHNKSNVSESERIMSEIHKLEPPVDSSEDTREFISSKFKEYTERDKMMGDDDMRSKAIKYKYLNRLIKNLVERKDTIYNDLMNTLANNGVSVAELPGGGYVKAFKKEGSRNHQLTFSIKSASDVEKQADELSNKI